jgi:hypothetical protein
MGFIISFSLLLYKLIGMRLATSEAFRKHSLRRLEAQRVLLQPNLGVSAAQ